MAWKPVSVARLRATEKDVTLVVLVLVQLRSIALVDAAVALRDDGAEGARHAAVCPVAGDSLAPTQTCRPSVRHCARICRRHWRFLAPEATQAAISSMHARRRCV